MRFASFVRRVSTLAGVLFSVLKSVHPAVMGMRPNVTAAPLKGGGVSVPVHRLNAVSRVPLSGVCDSVLHGMVSESARASSNW